MLVAATSFYPVWPVRGVVCLSRQVLPLDWSWSVRHGSRPPLLPPPSPPCPRYDIYSSYFDKGREAGNGDGTGRDMGSLKNGYGPGLERGGCHPLNTTRRNKTSLHLPSNQSQSTTPTNPSIPPAAVISWLIPRRRLHHLFLLLPLCHPRGHGLSRVSSPLHPARPFPDN